MYCENKILINIFIWIEVVFFLRLEFIYIKKYKNYWRHPHPVNKKYKEEKFNNYDLEKDNKKKEKKKNTFSVLALTNISICCLSSG